MQLGILLHIPTPLKRDSCLLQADVIVFITDTGGFQATRSGGKYHPETAQPPVSQPSAVHLMSFISPK